VNSTNIAAVLHSMIVEIAQAQLLQERVVGKQHHFGSRRQKTYWYFGFLNKETTQLSRGYSNEFVFITA